MKIYNNRKIKFKFTIETKTYRTSNFKFTNIKKIKKIKKICYRKF